MDLALGDLQYNLLKIKVYYDEDFDEKNEELEEYLIDLDSRKERKLEINLQDVEDNAKSFWKKIILKFVDRLLSKINNRSSKGGEFAKIKSDLNETKKRLPYDNPDIQTLESIYERTMKEQYEIIKEKIQNEEYFDKKFKEGLFWGGLIGLAGGLIIGYAQALYNLFVYLINLKT